VEGGERLRIAEREGGGEGRRGGRRGAASVCVCICVPGSHLGEQLPLGSVPPDEEGHVGVLLAHVGDNLAGSSRSEQGRESTRVREEGGWEGMEELGKALNVTLRSVLMSSLLLPPPPPSSSSLLLPPPPPLPHKHSPVLRGQFPFCRRGG
jgi:hypothetical protein